MLPSNKQSSSNQEVSMSKLHAQSNKYREINDELSSILQNFEDLRPPNIVVVGEQSAGKSSVLEYLSGVKFVTGQDMVTRCPLQLRMNHSYGEEAKAIVKSAKIESPIEIPNPESEDGAKLLDDTIRNITQLHIGNETVANELIEVQVISPHVPDLTLVDLPGLITKSSKDNPYLAENIRELVRKNMTEKDCILIVGDGGRDLQTIVGFTEAEEVDKDQKRTLCVLTKVDKCINDKEIRQKLIKSLKNEGSISLLHGFVALKNRTSDEKHLSIEECEKIESSLLDSLDAPDGSKGRAALIEKLTQIQNEHLQESIPKQKELLQQELIKIESQLENTSNNIQQFYAYGDEALIRSYETSISSLVSAFKDISVNTEILDMSSSEDLKKSVTSNPLSLSVFSSVTEALSEEILTILTSSKTQINNYFEAITKFIDKTSGFPGLPDLYQPTILLKLANLEMANVRKVVDKYVLEAWERVKRMLLKHLVPKQIGSSKLEKMLKTELKQHYDSVFKTTKKIIDKVFRREIQRTFTMDKSYAVRSQLIRQLCKLKGKQQESYEAETLKEQLSQFGYSDDITFVSYLQDLPAKSSKQSAAIEVLIKFKSYLNIAATRIADQVSQILYDELIISPCEEMPQCLSVKRVNNKRVSNFPIEPIELPGVPIQRIIDVMKPSKSELDSYRKLLEKHQAVKKAIEVIDRLDWEY
ncbi:Mx protein [Naegleria gruberi]|uniref:Mx protein n=1 Tax=Naegleria gruberi TaxID=5762 RepID=D2VZK5_NAEGR|nr:Mx protein [Naegleria gruberi]EFC37672.1 Mx protein [Naegleria gruberi]|eukprot:XP_002670416.1 Mx protein [Naegleria gruberi]